MLRLRPTLLNRVREGTVGPLYLIIEHALTKLMDDLEAMPEGTMRSINAFDMDPSQQDWAMLDQLPSRRKKKTQPREPSNAPNDNPAGRGDAGHD